MIVDTDGLKTSCSQVTQASQTWDKEDKYWACDADGNLESSKAYSNDDDDRCPTK